MKLIKTLFIACMITLMAGSAFAGDVELAKKSTINDILARGELRVGFDPGYMPFEMTDKKGNYIGFDIDLARELAKAMGVKFVPVSIEFDSMIGSLTNGKIDVIISAMTITPQRNLKVGFTNPYIEVSQSILVNKKHEGKITSWQQLNDPQYIVISRQGTTGEEATKRFFPKSQFKSFEKESEGALEVANGRADAWVYDRPFNSIFFSEQGKDSIYHLTDSFTFEPLGMAINQGDPDFMNFLNNFLYQIKKDGRYDKMYEKWINSVEWFNETQK